MVSEGARLVFVGLPAMIGLVTIGYLTVLIVRDRVGFFRALRGWLVISLTVGLAMFWVNEVLRWSGLSDHSKLDSFASVGLAILSTWLALGISALGTKYRRLNHTDEFLTWLKEHQLNEVSAWGLIGLAVLFAELLYISGAPGEVNGLLVKLPGGAYLIASVLLMIGLWIRHAARPRAPSREGASSHMTLIAGSWLGITAVVILLGAPFASEGPTADYNPLDWILLVLSVVLWRAIWGTRMVALVIDPDAESVRKEGFREYDIPRGSYLIHDERSDAAFVLFTELISLPLRPDALIPGKETTAAETLEFLIPKGLVITREFPEKVRKKHKLQTTPIIWLTESPGERRIAPTSLAMLTDTIVRFMESNPNSIVLLEGIEYICTFNDFRKVLRFLDALNEAAWLSKSRLLLTVNPKAFDTRDLALLERDRNVIVGAQGVGNLKVESRTAIEARKTT